MTREFLTLRSKQYPEHRLSVVNNTRESIFEYKYLREYEAKIEKTLHGMRGPWAVSESIVNSKNRFAGLSL